MFAAVLISSAAGALFVFLLWPTPPGGRLNAMQVVPLEGRSERLQKGDDVLAVYVDTTSFYHATIAIPPRGRGAQIVSTHPRPTLLCCICLHGIGFVASLHMIRLRQVRAVEFCVCESFSKLDRIHANVVR